MADDFVPWDADEFEVRVKRRDDVFEVTVADQRLEADSAAEAVALAADIVRLATGECRSAHVEHCWCSEEMGTDGAPGLKCCLCDTWERLPEADGKPRLAN